MTQPTLDLGDIAKLAVALGITNADGNPNGKWFQKPFDYLKEIFSNDEQRSALLNLINQLLNVGSECSQADAPPGDEWFEILRAQAEGIALNLVIEADQGDKVHIGLGVVAESDDPASTTKLHLPLFQVPKAGSVEHAEELFLLGKENGQIVFSTNIDIAP